MFFQKKIDKSMEWLKNKSKESNNKDEEVDFDEHYDPKAEWDKENSGIDLEKGDVLALIISGLLVLSPILIIFILIMLWAAS